MADHPHFHWFGQALALMVSFMAAFFVVFNVLFSDVLALTDRLMAVVMVFGVYLFFSWLFTKIWPPMRQAWFWWFITPATVIALMYTGTEPDLMLYSVSIVVALLLATTLGTRFFPFTQAGSGKR